MISGIVNVYKETGYTSHDVVAVLRGIFQQKKIGHTGTLDPDAVGVLPVCLGKATKVCDLLTEKDKTYHVVMLLGRETETQDISGDIITENNTQISAAEISAAAASFCGAYKQTPPMYSALKVNGKKLYELARAGITIERKARLVHIYRLQIEEINFPRVVMTVDCSKGTYIRTLCHDIGQKLGCGGCMEQLKRTRVSNFTIDNSLSLEEIEAAVKRGETAQILAPIDSLFLHLVKVIATKEINKAVENGNQIPIGALVNWEAQWQQEQLRLYTWEGRFVGIYKWKENTQAIMPIKLFLEKE
jgi:tRNA pseudouridine55 synthase